MHTRPSRLHRFAITLWIGIISGVGANDILSHTEPTGEKIVLSCPFEEPPDWCFLPVEIQAENPGKRPADWHVAVSSQNYLNATNFHSSFDFRATPGNAACGSVLVPMGGVGQGRPSYGSYYVMFEAARAGGGSGRGNLSTVRSSRTASDRTILGTKDVITLLDHPSGTLFHHELAAGDWRAYCGFHNLYLTAMEWEAMPPAARTAIKHWVRLGGHLNLIRHTPGKTLAELGFPKPDSGQETGGVCRGLIAQQTLAEIHAARGVKPIADATKTDWAVRATSGDAVKEWRERDAGAFAVPSAQLAAGFMLVVVVGFAVLVGPLNVFVLAAARRRHRLFITTPLISLAAGGLLVGSVILSDGIGGKGERYVWLESGPAGENTNYLVQHQHSRCGAMFSTGFEIPEDAFFAPMILETGELSGNLAVNLEPGKVKAAGPWFSSRRSQNFYLAAARPGRGRIEKSGTDAQPVLTSSFDFPIDRIFWLAADAKTWWQAGTLAQGNPTPLRPCTAAEVRQALEAATAHAPPEYGRDLTATTGRPGYFLAIAKGISAIETHQSIRWQTHGFVTGPAITP